MFMINIQMQIHLKGIECSLNSWMTATTLSLHPLKAHI